MDKNHQNINFGLVLLSGIRSDIWLDSDAPDIKPDSKYLASLLSGTSLFSLNKKQNVYLYVTKILTNYLEWDSKF